MKKQYFFFVLLSFILLLVSCSKDEVTKNDNIPDITEKPEVEQKIENYVSGINFVDDSKVDSVSIIDDTTIILYSNSHLDEKLKVGDKFVYSNNNTAQDYFVGCIKSIDVSEKTYTIHTEIPSFSEIFSGLRLSPKFENTNVIVEFVPNNEDNVIFNGIVDNSVWNEIETIYLAQDSTTDTRSVLRDEFSVPIDLTLSFEAKPNQVFKGDIYLRLKGRIYIYDTGNYEMSVQQIVGLKGSFSMVSQSINRRYIPLLKTNNGITLYSNRIVGVRLKPSLNFFYSGEIKLEAGFKYEVINADCYTSFENGEFYNKSLNNKKDSYFRVKSLHTEAEFGLSLNNDLYAFIFTEKFFSAGLNAVGGLGISGEKNVGIQFPDFANFDFSISFSPFLEITPFLSIKTNTLKRFEGPTFKISSEKYKRDLLPNIHDINYKRKATYLTVSSKIENESTSFLKTKEDGIALFEKDKETPIAYKRTNTINTKAVSPDVSFDLVENGEYEIARYARTEDGKEVFGERITVYEEDHELREALIKLYQSTDGDNWIHNENWCSDKPLEEWYGVEIDSYNTELHLSNNNLTGKIKQSFPENIIIELYCNANQLTSIDVSGGLNSLECYNNQLTSLDVSGCTFLRGLYCGKNSLTTLDVSDCTDLRVLDCRENQLTHLNFSGCTELKNLTCYDNQLTSLDISGYTYLETLACMNNQLISLDVSRCTALKHLYSNDNQLTSLNVSECTALDFLHCSKNQLTSLDFSRCTALRSLLSDDNQLTSLNVSECTALESLHCGNNHLTSLNVSRCTALRTLDCSDNKLASLDVSKCSILETLFCSNNRLTFLDVSGCYALDYLACSNNQLTVLDITKCTVLTTLYCQKNMINSVISDWFSQLKVFCYDPRYEYYTDDNGATKYKDSGIGWWYLGEPEKGYHRPN